MGGVLAWESWSNRTNSKPEACDTGAPGAGAKRVSELRPLPPLRTHKTSSLLFDHPASTHLRHCPWVTQWALAPMRSTHVKSTGKGNRIHPSKTGFPPIRVFRIQKGTLNLVQSLTLNQLQSSRRIEPGSIIDFEPSLIFKAHWTWFNLWL